jgi:hypothetical protein
VYQNEISTVNGFGILLVIAGSSLYSHVRYAEMKSKVVGSPQVVSVSNLNASGNNNNNSNNNTSTNINNNPVDEGKSSQR